MPSVILNKIFDTDFFWSVIYHHLYRNNAKYLDLCPDGYTSGTSVDIVTGQGPLAKCVRYNEGSLEEFFSIYFTITKGP